MPFVGANDGDDGSDEEVDDEDVCNEAEEALHY